MPQQAVRPTVTHTAAEIRLGNIWLIAATYALGVLGEADAATGQPAILTIDAGGDMRAVGPEHDEYDERLASKGFACTASAQMDVQRLAARLRAAVLAGEAAG